MTIIIEGIFFVGTGNKLTSPITNSLRLENYTRATLKEYFETTSWGGVVEF